jgi:sortase A
MLLEQPVLEGADTYVVLNKGIWHWPQSSTPDRGGNTVLIGHRFTYTRLVGVFYALDKVAVGDEVGVWWDDKQYVYKVSKVQVVPSTQTSILNATAEPTLTMYTCTPLWNPKDRLVVTAQLAVQP